MGRPIKAGTADQSTVIRILDSTTFLPEEAVEHDTAGIALWYRREGAVKTAISPAALAALDTAHADGGIEHIDDGYYRLDLPDAAVASASAGVAIGGTVTGMIVVGNYHTITAYDPYDSVRMGMTALPNAAADAAGGLPISDAGGLDIDAIKTETDKIGHADYGLAKLVRSTTPANTLDVASTGEAGLDFANIKQAAGATTLTNITVPTVTTLTNAVTVGTNNDKTGYTLHADYNAAKTAAQAGDNMDLVNAPNALAVGAIQDGLATGAEITALAGYGDTNWATATGFSTLDAAGVRVAVGLATADLDIQLDGITSGISGITVPTAGEIKTEIEGAGGHLALILEDTNELQLNQGNWLTATGFATVGAAMTLTAAYDAAKTAMQAGSTVDADIKKINGVVVTGTGTTGAEWGPV